MFKVFFGFYLNTSPPASKGVSRRISFIVRPLTRCAPVELCYTARDNLNTELVSTSEYLDLSRKDFAMKLVDDTRPIYSNETETVVFRGIDYKNIIAEHLHLPVKELVLLDKASHPEILTKHPETQPDRAWGFYVTFQTLEGDKEAEVTVGLKDNVLFIYSCSRPILKIFKAKVRNRAKEGIPDLTLDYIDQLEQVGVSAWGLWKQLYEYVYAQDDPHLERVATNAFVEVPY